ncbi:hypothetical protein, partial [Salmonella enterica]|uniref:hypothetical protein n=1 Tax=Salmonella enterica TaxID=28901 RepID=UPI003D2AAD86
MNENEMYYTGNGCKVLGLSNNSNCIRYSFSAQLYNQTSSTLVLTGDMVTAVNFQSVTYRFS